MSGWSSRHKLRPGSKHLCGQTCLHKLVDEFIAKAIAVRAQRPAEEPAEEIARESQALTADASLTSDTAYVALESSARIISTPPAVAPAPALGASAVIRPQPAVPSPLPAVPLPLLPRPTYHPQPELVTSLPRPHAVEYPSLPEESPRFASHTWRAAAWEREREREMRAVSNRSDRSTRRASNA
ncbi:MAG TPA: hypothetical protein VMT38_03695 [Terracidiphilus sp.]|nr:hypothetical protein [Terracidiphilus sp.]